MKKLLICITSAAIAAFSANALAHSQPKSAIPTKDTAIHPGLYLGFQGGISFVDYKNPIAPGFFAHRLKTQGMAARIQLGYDFNPYLGTELSVTYFHKPTLININSDETNDTIKNNLVQLAAKLSYPFSKKLSPYATIGYGYVVRSGVSHDGSIVLSDLEIPKAMFGAGLTYALHRRWMLDASWIYVPSRAKNNLPASNYVGIGIQYRFSH